MEIPSFGRFYKTDGSSAPWQKNSTTFLPIVKNAQGLKCEKVNDKIK
jgi:hypothetical protein